MTEFNAQQARMKRPFPFWVDSFQGDVQGLSADQVGAYTLILSAMWKKEGCDLLNDDAYLARIARVSLRVWRSRIAPHIKPLFTEEGGKLCSKMLKKEAVFVEKHVTLQSTRKSGKKRPNPLENKEVGKSTDTSTDQSTDTSAENPTQQPNNPTERTNVLSSPSSPPGDGESQNPTIPEAISEDHPTHDPPGELIDPTALKPLDEASQAVNAWNELAAECGLSQVQKLTPDRRKKLGKRLKDCDGIEGWMCALDKIRSTPGLQGKAGRPWKANFDFLIQENKFVKLMEGGYDGWTTNGYGTANGYNAAPERRSNRDNFDAGFFKAVYGRQASP